MSNPYFKFKHFTIYHDRCAMKVGTDGVLLGAWANVSGANNALDIGTGSGLIALMLAQRNALLYIDAIEIDPEALGQAAENVAESPFSQQIHCHNLSLATFSKQCANKYDVIVCNPPFFIQSLHSPNEKRTLARHTDSLPIEELIEAGASLLSSLGTFSFIFPYEHREFLLQLGAENALYPSRITHVYPSSAHVAKRVLIEFSNRGDSTEKELEENNLLIEESRHCYSLSFAELVKDFYQNV